MTHYDGQTFTSVPFRLRPGTNDEVIYNSVVTRNEYRLPSELGCDAVVVDIGVHIGSFSHLALTRGAGSLFGFEPEPSNYACARQNLAPFGDGVHLYNHAVWRSDIPGQSLPFYASSDQANLGGGTLIWETDGSLVEAVPFDEIVDDVSRRGACRIDVLKIDCEGAEFPILLTSRLLNRIDRIVRRVPRTSRAAPVARAHSGLRRVYHRRSGSRARTGGLHGHLGASGDGDVRRSGLVLRRTAIDWVLRDESYSRSCRDHVGRARAGLAAARSTRLLAAARGRVGHTRASGVATRRVHPWAGQRCSP